MGGGVVEDGGLVDEDFGPAVFPAEGVGAQDAEPVVVAGADGASVGESGVEDSPGGGDLSGRGGDRWFLLVMGLEVMGLEVMGSAGRR